jgi:hypothetical protein
MRDEEAALKKAQEDNAREQEEIDRIQSQLAALNLQLDVDQTSKWSSYRPLTVRSYQWNEATQALIETGHDHVYHDDSFFSFNLATSIYDHCLFIYLYRSPLLIDF